MRSPSLSWVGYNLLRLTALVILTWTLAVQFIAIGDDMKAYSEASSDPTTSTGASNSGNSAGVSSTSSKNPYAAPTMKHTSTLTTTAAIDAISSSNSKRNEIEYHSDEKLTYIVKRADEENEIVEANWGLSSVPRHAGGVVFPIISRIVIACTLALLIFGQLGWPEMFLYKWVPWLGPQSTPIWLGTVQTIVAIETLRVYAKTTVLLPSWALFAIGLVNMTIGGILLYFGRKLPKNPSPPLYFNLSTRLIYFQTPPKCFDPIRYSRKTQINDPEAEAGIEKKKLPPSNLKTIGLDSDNEDDIHDKLSIHSELDMELPIQSQYLNKPDKRTALTDYKDVTKGGYPTFSGGGLIDPSTQVPLGFIEHTKDGRKIEFVSENGQPTQSTQNRSNSPPTAWKGNKSIENKGSVQKRSELPPRGQSSRKKSATTDVPRQLFDKNDHLKRKDLSRSRADSVDTLTLISRGNLNFNDNQSNDNEISRSHTIGMTDASGRRNKNKKSTLSSMTFGPLSLGSSPTSNSKSIIPSLPAPGPVPKSQYNDEELKDNFPDLIVKRSNSQKGRKDLTERQSSTSSYLSAEGEIGPRFPLPPSRQTSLKISSTPNSDSDDSDTNKGFQDIMNSPLPLQYTTGLVVEPKGEPKGPRPPFRSNSKRGKTEAAPEEKRNKFKSPLELLKHPKSPKSPKTPKTPKSPKSHKRIIARRRSSSSSHTSPRQVHHTISSPNGSSRISTRKRAATLATPSIQLQPSLTSMNRSSSTKSNKGARTARGVRFNLSPTKEIDEVSSLTAGGSGSSSEEEEEEEEEEEGEVKKLAPKSIRISGINDIQIDTVGTPRSKMERPESMTLSNMELKSNQLQGQGGRNGRSRSKTVSERSDVEPQRDEKKRGTTMVLGGGCLDGGKERF